MSSETENEQSVAIVNSSAPVIHMKVLQRAHELPLVKSATTCVTTYYQQAKDYSRLVNGTLNMAEYGAKLAGRAVNPVVTRLDGNINKVDDIACQALDALAKRYPSLKMETEEVATSIKKAGADVRGGAEKYGGALLETTPGQVALIGLAGYLQVANKVADITLPEDTSESNISFESSNLALQNVAVLSDKLYRRVCRQSTDQLQFLQEISTKALLGIQSHLTALETITKANLDKYGITQQTTKRWEQLQSKTHSAHLQTLVVAGKISQQLHDGTSAVTERTLQLTQQISSHLVSLYDAAANSAKNLPEAVQDALSKAKALADKLYMQLSQIKSIEDLTTLVFSQIRETMEMFRNSISYLIPSDLQSSASG